MVFIVDEGSVFDAPLDKIWKFLQTPPDVHNHPANQNVEAEMQPDNSMITSFDNDGPGGMKVSNKIRFTMFPPAGMLAEYSRGTTYRFQNDAVLHPDGRKDGNCCR